LRGGRIQTVSSSWAIAPQPDDIWKDGALS
jgi:hypothetical protein